MLKRLLFLVLLAVAALPAAGQAPNFTLTKTIGTPVDFPHDVTVDKAGFMYLLDGARITKLAANGDVVQSIPLRNNSSGYNALDSDDAGNLYVCDVTNSRIEKYSPTGDMLLAFGSAGSNPGQFRSLESLAVDGAGNIYVADTDNNRLQKFSPTGTLLFAYSGTATTALNHPMDVCVDDSGIIYLFNEDFKITKLSAAGTLLQTIPVAASVASYDDATSLAVDPAGNIYTSSFEGRSILKFTAAGTYVSTIGQGVFDGTHTPLALDAAGNVYATNRDHGGNSKLRKYSASGTLLNTWGNMKSLGPVAMDAVGNYYYFDSQLVKVCKFSPAGQLLGQFGDFTNSDGASAMALDAAGNIYLLGLGYPSASILKMAPDGRVLNRYTNLGGNITYTSSGVGMAVDAAGFMYVTDLYSGCIRRISPQGQLMPTIGTRGTGLGQLFLPQDVAVDAHGYVYATDNGGSRVQRFTPNGQVVQEFGVRTTMNSSHAVSTVHMTVDGTGSPYISSTLLQGVQRYDANTGVKTSYPQLYKGYMAIDRRASRLITVSGDRVRFYASDLVRPENLITGTIFQDLNGNCIREANEQALPHIAVVAQPGNYFGLTNENGQYALAVDTGPYTVEQLLPTGEVGRTITPVCATTPLLSFAGYGATLPGPDFGNEVSTRAHLSVRVASNRRRRCFRNSTTVTYANTGFASAANAQVRVALPEHVLFLSATSPHTRDAQGNYLFQVGTLAPNTTGTLTIQDSVACGNPDIRGLTVCTKAWITPLNSYPPPPAWNQASMTVESTLQPGNQVRVVLRNHSAYDMTDSLAFRVYQNSALSLQHRYRLPAGDSLVLRIPATRPVVRTEADQPAGHPTQHLASSTIEVRALGTTGQINPAMLAFAPNSVGPEVAEDCQPIIDSFDPNDKLVLPVGTTDQHYTPTGVPLLYQVRFQNTGSDDAYRVEVVDTLAANLDLRTLRVTTASHPYRLSVAGRGRPVLTFTFTNINLPPSSRDEAGSNGFVQFSIQPKAALPARTLVENKADIFFDYNPAVRTNTTENRLYDVPATIVAAMALEYAGVVASPTLTQVSPGQGKAGTLITLRGQRFGATSATNTVRFNGVATPVLSASATTLTVRVPSQATTGSVVVITGDGGGRSAQDFIVYQPPTLAGMVPAEGVPGSLVTLTGLHFAPNSAQDTVWFNDVPALVQQASATTLQVRVPAGAVSGNIRVGTLGGQTVSAQRFVVWHVPTLTSFTPVRGKAGDIVTVTGTNFAPATRNEVAVGPGAATVVQASGTSLQLRVPASAQTGPLRVQTPGGVVVSAAAFTFLPAPAITAFTPAQASVGEVLTLAGANFLVDGRPDTVLVGGMPAAVLAATATTATIRVPAGARSGPLTIGGIGGRTQTATTFTLLNLSAAEAIAVYPNPVHGAVTLDWLRADFPVEDVQVFDALGKLVTTLDLRRYAGTTASLPFTTGQTGLYLLVIHTARGPVYKRISVY